MKTIICISALALVLIVACNNNHNKDKDIANFVNEWKNREILFPTNSIFSIRGKNYANFQIPNSEYKI